MNPYAKPFVPTPLNPEEDHSQAKRQVPNHFARAVAAANVDKRADEELTAFLEWASKQKQTQTQTQTRGGSRKKRGTRSKHKRS
jgi:hypothetical protein